MSGGIVCVGEGCGVKSKMQRGNTVQVGRNGLRSVLYDVFVNASLNWSHPGTVVGGCRGVSEVFRFRGRKVFTTTVFFLLPLPATRFSRNFQVVV